MRVAANAEKVARHARDDVRILPSQTVSGWWVGRCRTRYPSTLSFLLLSPPPSLLLLCFRPCSYTLSMGGAGSGASLHMHEAAVNVVVYGTRKWFVRS